MPVMERERIALRREPQGLPEAEYPPEVMTRLNRIREEVDAQIAKGEKLETLEEYAARREPQNLPTAEYPPEVMARWDKEMEIIEAQLATGELRPMSIAEIAGKVGIKNYAGQ